MIKIVIILSYLMRTQQSVCNLWDLHITGYYS